ncbi:MAG: glycosyltransferase, partial [Spirochaetes bacterium]|nr:glycosyltransferase [Spirochaetota bacterium]
DIRIMDYIYNFKFFIFLIFYIIFIFRIINFYKLNRLKNKSKSNNNEKDNNIKISIIIPIRNEEKNILYILNDLTNQTYNNFEIIIIDDNSEDRSEVVIKDYIINYNINFSNYYLNNNIKISYYKLNYNLEVFKNWQGKSAACYYGTLFALNDFLLFIDADVRLEKDALEYIIKNYKKDSILTIQPYHYTKKFYEQFSMYFNIIAFIGMDLGKIINTNKTKNGLFGPFIFLPKEIYYKTNGHLNVKEYIIEDIMLGKFFVNLGYEIISIPHLKKIKYRMYPNGFKDLINGWIKNISLGALKTSVWVFLIITSFIAFSTSITLNLLSSIFSLNLKNILVSILFYSIFSFINFYSFNFIGSFKFISLIIFPIHLFLFLLIFIISFIMKIFRIPVNWKNRKILIK